MARPAACQVDTGSTETLGRNSLIGSSRAFMEVLAKIPRLAHCEATVLICGETGTGKEMVARTIHECGDRRDHPFVPVNCGAIPVDLVENELFGHEKSAYTGATSREPGLIYEAEGGTLFLDEVDSLPLQVQVKLLRFLQEREYRPLGSSRTRTANVRLIAATNADVEQAVNEGRLRLDLYYRLNVLPLELPPLRARSGDIPLLAQHFLRRFNARQGRNSRLTPPALCALMQHNWPGNVRELEHAIERAVILAEGEISVGDLGLEMEQDPMELEPFKLAKAKAVAHFEISYIKRLLTAYSGNISRAAVAARKNRRAFFELIRKHEIDASRFRTRLSA